MSTTGRAALIIPLTTMVSHTFSRMSYSFLLPAIKDDFALSNATAGWGGTIIFVAYFSGVIAVTLTASRVEPIWLMRCGLLLGAIGLLALALAPGIGVAFVGLALANFGAAGIWITAPILATEGTPFERRGMVIGLLTGSMGLAQAITALATRVARSLADDENLWRPVYLTMAIITVIIALLVWALVRPCATQRPGGLAIGAITTMPRWLPITAAYVIFGAIASGFASFLAEAMETDGGLQRSTVSNVYVLLGLGTLLLAPGAGWVGDRFGRLVALGGVLVITAAASIAVATLHGSVLAVVIVAIGGVWFAYPPLTATYVRDHLDDRSFGAVFGAMTVFYSLAAIPPPVVTGLIADATDSFALAYWGFAALCLLSVSVLAFGRDRRTPIPTQ